MPTHSENALAERVLNAEMDHHLAGEEPGNRRNGYGRKTVVTDTGTIELEVPRDRQAGATRDYDLRSWALPRRNPMTGSFPFFV